MNIAGTGPNVPVARFLGSWVAACELRWVYLSRRLKTCVRPLVRVVHGEDALLRVHPLLSSRMLVMPACPWLLET